MKNIRLWHVYLGTFFAPLLIYYSLSGAWQVFRLNDVPKDKAPSIAQKFFHEVSKPHKDSTLPGANPKQGNSLLFKIFSAMMALGFVATALLGIQMALQVSKRRAAMTWCLLAGLILPVLFLLTR